MMALPPVGLNGEGIGENETDCLVVTTTAAVGSQAAAFTPASSLQPPSDAAPPSSSSFPSSSSSPSELQPVGRPGRRVLLLCLLALCCFCLLLLLRGLLLLPQPAMSVEKMERVVSLPPLSASCPRTLTFSFTGIVTGLGSKLDQMLTAAAACLREQEGRQLFLDDRNWNYASFHSLFLPSAAIGPELPGWNDAATLPARAVAEQLLWPPLLSVRQLAADLMQGQHHLSTLVMPAGFALPPASPLSQYGLLRHNATHDLLPRRFLSQSAIAPLLLSPHPPLQSALGDDAGAGAESASAAAAAVPCSPPHWSENYHVGAWSPAPPRTGIAEESTVSAHYALPHIYAEHAYGYPPTLWYDKAKTRWPELQLFPAGIRFLHELYPEVLPAPQPAEARWWPNGSLHVQYQAAGTSLLLPAPHLLFTLKQRLFHELLLVRPEYRQQAASKLQSLGWTPRSSVWEAAWRRLAAAQDADGSAGSGSDNPYISFHVRRQDKGREIAQVVQLPAFVAAAERIVSADKRLQRAFALSALSSPSPSCAADGSGLYAVRVMLLSDDDSTLDELRRLRPCWRVESAVSAEPGLVRSSDEQVGKQSAEWKLRMAQRLMVSLVLLAEADYAVVTFSSNIGRLTALARGWVDWQWAGRTVSLDADFFHI